MAETKVRVKKETGVKEDRGINFWTDKAPCWELANCPEMIKTCLLYHISEPTRPY